MNTAELQKKLDSTEIKITQLVNRYKSQQERLIALEKENQVLRESSKVEHTETNGFQNTGDFAKIANYLAPDGNGVVGLKEKIDGHIKDIEHCITFINRQL